VFDTEVIFPVIGQTLLKLSVFLSGDISWFALPDGFVLVDFFLFVCDFFYLFGFLLCLLLVCTFLLNFAFFVLLLFLFLLFLILVIIVSDIFFLCLFTLEFYRELDEFRVLADDVLQLLFIQVLQLVILHV